MFIDLDRFKTINDSLGHLTGDHLLKEVANRLCRVVRAVDTVARLGGDEFVVLVPGVRAADECALVGDKIIAALAEPVRFEGRSLHISPSIGICLYPDDGEDVETLMRKADAAMYHAKASGRNNYQFFAERMNAAAARHFELETSLRGALERARIHAVLPADRRHRDGACGLEVLLRWRRPEPRPGRAGRLHPDAGGERPDRAGRRMGDPRRLRTGGGLARAGLPAVPLAVNLSARQFMHRGLIESIRRIVDETGIDPAMLEFEITETALMQHGQQTWRRWSRSRPWASACRSTTSAPAIRAWPT
jgi:diguanylate cyclase (GGDEF)-like protein